MLIDQMTTLMKYVKGNAIDDGMWEASQQVSCPGRGAALCRKEGGAPPLSRVAGLPWCGAADPAIQEESGNSLNECLTQNNF